MNRARTLLAVIAIALAMSACSGGDEPEAKPTKTSASPTPTVPVQPQGEFGVTYDIQNWDEIAKDDDKLKVVLAWKKANEAFAASTNQKKFLAAARSGASEKFRRQMAKALKFSWSNGYTVKKTGYVTIRSAKVDGSTGKIDVCLWKPSIDRYKGSKYVGKFSASWDRSTATMKKSGDRWIWAGSTFNSSCKELKAP